MKAFKKGEAVTLLGDWDRQGTVYFAHAIVHSCGAKQMVLTREGTGEEMGRHFAPVKGDLTKYSFQWVVARMTDAEAEAACLKAAELVLAHEREGFASCIQRNSGNEGYIAAINRQVAALHEPRALNRCNATTNIGA